MERSRDTPYGLLCPRLKWGEQQQLLPGQFHRLAVPPPGAQLELQGCLPLPDLDLSGVSAQQGGNVPPLPVQHHLAHPLTTGEHGVQILVQKGLEPPLSAAGVHLLKEPFQPRLGPSRTAPDLYAPAQPHQLHQGGVHDGDRLPDGPVQLQLPPAQGHIPVQRAEGMPLLVPKLDLRRLRRRFFPHEPFQFLPSIPAVRIRAASLIRRPAPPYWRRIHPFSGLPL
ncbi:MAG: hypothetical protein ACLR0P_00975 [Oscillospiraceae bacterium]